MTVWNALLIWYISFYNIFKNHGAFCCSCYLDVSVCDPVTLLCVDSMILLSLTVHELCDPFCYYL